MATTQSTRVRRAVQRYAASIDELRGVTDAYVALVTRLLDDAGINYLTVSGRTKTVESFAGKAARRLPGGRLAHPKPLTDITDQVKEPDVAWDEFSEAARKAGTSDRAADLDALRRDEAIRRGRIRCADRPAERCMLPDRPENIAADIHLEA